MAIRINKTIPLSVIFVTVIILSVSLYSLPQTETLRYVTSVTQDENDAATYWIGTATGVRPVRLFDARLREGDLFLAGEKVNDLLSHETDLYVATDTGLYRRTSSRGEITELQSRLLYTKVVDVEWLNDRVYAATNAEVLYSDDKGRTWISILVAGSNASTILEGHNTALAIGHDKSNREIVYLGTAGRGLHRFSPALGWVSLNSDLPQAIGAAPIAPVQAVSVNPKNANNVFVALEGKGIYKSFDGGNRWLHLNLVPRGAIYSFIPAGVLVDKKNPSIVVCYVHVSFASHNQEAWVFISSDGGDSWKTAARFAETHIVGVLPRYATESLEYIVITQKGSFSIKASSVSSGLFEIKNLSN